MLGHAMARVVTADVPWLEWMDWHNGMRKPTPILIYICPQLLLHLQQWKSRRNTFRSSQCVLSPCAAQKNKLCMFTAGRFPVALYHH